MTNRLQSLKTQAANITGLSDFGSPCTFPPEPCCDGS